MRCWSWRHLVVAVSLAHPLAIDAQRGNLAGVVVSRETNEPLAFTIVSLPLLGRELFATDLGAFVFGDLPVGPQPLRVRRIGFAPLDTTVEIRAGTDTLRLRLAHTAVRLEAVMVRAYPPCLEPGAPTLDADTSLALVFAQLRMNADQYRLLSEQYPFESAMELTRSHKERNGPIRPDGRVNVRVPSKQRWEYKPGAVVEKQLREYIFNIPTIVHFADDRFIAEHCFYLAGVDSVNGFPVVRIDFLAAERVKFPDVSGSLYLDTQTFQIMRSELHLTHIPQIRAMTGYQMTTDFDQLMESVPVIARTHSYQSFDILTNRSWEAIIEERTLIGVKFLGRKPGERSH